MGPGHRSGQTNRRPARAKLRHYQRAAPVQAGAPPSLRCLFHAAIFARRSALVSLLFLSLPPSRSRSLQPDSPVSDCLEEPNENPKKPTHRLRARVMGSRHRGRKAARKSPRCRKKLEREERRAAPAAGFVVPAAALTRAAAAAAAVALLVAAKQLLAQAPAAPPSMSPLPYKHRSRIPEATKPHMAERASSSCTASVQKLSRELEGRRRPSALQQSHVDGNQ
jgi:hypothetical protein